MFHFADDPEHEIEIPGFPTREAAIEYARRRVRRSLEELRKPGQTPEELRHLWYTFGEDCRVIGPEGLVYRALSELEHFIRHPATPEESDYNALYESLLPGGFALTCEWAAGTVPPPYHYEYRIVLRPYEPPSDAGEALYPRMQGEITFWPDYPGPDVPVWKEQFSVWIREALRVYALLQDGGFLGTKPPQKDEDVPIGGETVDLKVTAQGRTWRIRSADLPPEQRTLLLETVMPAVRKMVPDPVWERLEARRRAYHQGAEPSR